MYPAVGSDAGRITRLCREPTGERSASGHECGPTVALGACRACDGTHSSSSARSSAPPSWPGRHRLRSSPPGPASPCTRTRLRTRSGSSGPRPRDRRLPRALRLLREQRAGRQPDAEPGAERGDERVGQLVRRENASARRPVRHLRAGPVPVPERLAVDLGRSELVLDGHDAGPPGVHDDRPFEADGGAPARGRQRRSSRTRTSR